LTVFVIKGQTTVKATLPCIADECAHHLDAAALAHVEEPLAPLRQVLA
jgi:hypothetical protein